MYGRSLLTSVRASALIFALGWFASGCSGTSQEKPTAARQDPPIAKSTARPAACDDGNGGIRLPEGFCATVFADNIGHARHLTVAANGDVYVNTSSNTSNKMTNVPGGFVVVLRDADQDGHAETMQRFGPAYQPGLPGGGTGIFVRGDSLWVEEPGRIVLYKLSPELLVPNSEREVILSGLPVDGDHTMHPFTISVAGRLYVNSGSASNSCQEKNRTAGSPGREPCPELPIRASIWRYDATPADHAAQTFGTKEPFATGLRNTVALAVNPSDSLLYAAVHGRDQLSENWPKLYSDARNDELPAEMFVQVNEGEDFGWPKCYFDAGQKKYLLAPEYGGDGGKAQGPCVGKKMPMLTFPAHWAPDGLTFYTGTMFPARYRDGAFIAFHGSWNRKPIQSGFLVAFVPFTSGLPAATFEEFATGFAGKELPADPAKAEHRPVGVAAGPDGALYVADDVGGRVWRIIYKEGR
jgi:glucose/arabinose dehydrogenase